MSNELTTTTPASASGATGVIPQSDLLSEASPLSLAQLMDSDPETMTDANVRDIVAELRRQAERFVQTEAEKASAKRTRAPKAAAILTTKTTASLDDLL